MRGNEREINSGGMKNGWKERWSPAAGNGVVGDGWLTKGMEMGFTGYKK